MCRPKNRNTSNWYEEVHSVEVFQCAGHVAMKRGELSPLQIDPHHTARATSWSCAPQQTGDLALRSRDFSGTRTRCTAPAALPLAPRSSSGSIARNRPLLQGKISGTRFLERMESHMPAICPSIPGKTNDAPPLGNTGPQMRVKEQTLSKVIVTSFHQGVRRQYSSGRALAAALSASERATPGRLPCVAGTHPEARKLRESR